MLAASIGDILVVSGLATALAGLATAIFPVRLLSTVFGVQRVEPATAFFARHWGVLIFVVGLLIVGSAFTPTPRPLVLAGAALEKFAIVGLIFFGPLKRTMLMTVAAVADGLFAVLYVAYLFGA